MENSIYSQVMKHYTKHNCINGVQHGFLKGLSCDTQLVTTVEQLQRGLDKKAHYDVIVFYFQKAFDKVSHLHLLRKLHAGGVRGKLPQWMATHLAQKTQRVVVDGAMSQEARVLSVVPQGTVLGPQLFMTYIDDIKNNIKGQSRHFAYGALLYNPIKTEAGG